MIDIEKYFNSIPKSDCKPSLDAMKFLINEYNNFDSKMNFIHIAGTNGKGSCTEMISNILYRQGYKVGKFISPHLINRNERISINKIEISDKEMSDLIEELTPIMNKYFELTGFHISTFELITFMALLYFYRKGVDLVVLETGLGGLNDCTNIIKNTLVSVITSIGYDHTNILGKTLPEIALHKAGIIKENSNTVFFNQLNEINDIFINACNQKNNIYHLITQSDIKNYSFDDDFQYFDYKDFAKIPVNLKGFKQIQNASLCIECMLILNSLGYTITEKSIKEGLSTVIHKGRMETLNKSPLVIFDGAHNEPAILNLQDTVNMYYRNKKRVYIISILKRKNYFEMLRLLLQDDNATFILTSGNNPEKYVSSQELYNISLNYKKANQTVLQKSLDEAIQFSLNSDNNFVNLFIGSFYVYNDVVNKFKA